METDYVTQTLNERADDHDSRLSGESAVRAAHNMVTVGLWISGILTVFYLMLLVVDAVRLPEHYAILFGLLVGIVAVFPAEFAMTIWRARLQGDRNITRAQKNIATSAMLMAGVFAALTTSSFFSYTLPQLFPAGYLAIAPTLNIVAIVMSWVVFILSEASYSISSRATRMNLADADAGERMFEARNSVRRGAAQAVYDGSAMHVQELQKRGAFSEDARRLISGALGGRDRFSLPAPARRDAPVPAMREETDEQARFRPAGNPAPFRLDDDSRRAPRGQAEQPAVTAVESSPPARRVTIRPRLVRRDDGGTTR